MDGNPGYPSTPMAAKPSLRGRLKDTACQKCGVRSALPDSDRCVECDSVDARAPRDLKPRKGKAPLWLIPAAPLRAIAMAFEDGATKYTPWNWTEPKGDHREVYGSALRRHVEAFTDPTEPDHAPDTGIHHLAHAGACLMILLYHLGADYVTEDQRRLDAMHPDTRMQSTFVPESKG